jgi:hypothetical protein
MICPECGSEYREGYVRCAACEVDLIEPRPVEPEVALVRVYESGNPALVPLFESMLADAGIEVLIKGEALQALFGAGQLGAGFNSVAGAVEFYVREDDADEARAIAASLERSEPGSEEGFAGDSD